MASAESWAIPKDSLVVVTGANGFIASNVVDQLLQAGFKVRGTVRSKERAGWMEKVLAERYGEGRFSLVEVPDMAAEGAFDEAVKGASGLAHTASPVLSIQDPNKAIPMVISGTLNALKAATEESSVKRVVLTSSSTAAASPRPNKIFTMDANTWNEAAKKAAWAPPPYEGAQRRLDVYSASKTQGEEEAWKYMKEEKPGFVFNSVLPNFNIGNIVSTEHQGCPSTAGWIKALWNDFKDNKELKEILPQHYIDVQDTARVHLGALVYSDVQNERLYAFAHPFNWNDILAIFRKLYPNEKLQDDYKDLGEDKSKVANERAEELVKRLGRPGWTSLEDSVKAVTETWMKK